MNKTPENLTCFSRDNIRPDLSAKVPQAQLCQSCQHSSWTRYNETKAPEDKPSCDEFFYAMFIDTVYKMPLRMYIRSLSKKPFEAGMSEWTNTLYMMRSQGLNPNIYDISFKLSTKKILTRGLPSYVINLSDFKAVTPEERAAFGPVYMQFVSQPEEPAEEPTIEADAKGIDAKVTNVGAYTGEDIQL